jgi:hypothetical protein
MQNSQLLGVLRVRRRGSGGVVGEAVQVQGHHQVGASNVHPAVDRREAEGRLLQQSALSSVRHYLSYCISRAR